MHELLRRRLAVVFGATLFFLPAFHPLLIPLVGVPSHLLWLAHVVPVELACYAWGRLGVLLVPLSAAAVLAGERTFGAGYGTPAPWETAIALATALSATHLLVAVVAVWAGRAACHLAAIAHRDPLTDLPNRRFLWRQLREVLARLRDGDRLALLFVDVDDFKLVNDGLGHVAGDAVLREVARRLRAGVQRSDFVCRWGGDEFVVLLTDLARSAAVMPILDRLHDAVQQPIRLPAHTLVPAVSIGVAVGRCGHSPERLIREADTALHNAKKSGKAQHAVFDHEMHRAAARRLDLMARLREALRRDEIRPYYQPIYCARSGKLCGIEALARWCPAGGEAVSPAEFIPVAEASGAIHELGERILAHTLTDLSLLQQSVPRLVDCFVSVNLSVRQLFDKDLPHRVLREIARHGLPASRLVLELTESMFMDRSPRVQAAIEALAEIGVTLAIDDFGAGYSSLGYLGRIPAAIMKIDRSLLAGHDATQRALIGPIVQMARAMRMLVVAEGIESAEQSEFLRSNGVDLLQGFFLGAPVSRERLPELLQASPSRSEGRFDANAEPCEGTAAA